MGGSTNEKLHSAPTIGTRPEVGNLYELVAIPIHHIRPRSHDVVLLSTASREGVVQHPNSIQIPFHIRFG